MEVPPLPFRSLHPISTQNNDMWSGRRRAKYLSKVLQGTTHVSKRCQALQNKTRYQKLKTHFDLIILGIRPQA